MRRFLSDILSGKSDMSSKRFITLLAFMLMATGFISNLFWKLEIAEFIYDSMKWIVIGGLGFTASEQFSNRVKSSSTYISQTKTTSKPKDDVIEITEENEKTDETDVIT